MTVREAAETLAGDLLGGLEPPDVWAKRIEAAILAWQAEARAPLVEAIRGALGTMQKPMERMVKVCALGLVEPACDHGNLRALAAAMRSLQEAHDAAVAGLRLSDGGTR